MGMVFSWFKSFYYDKRDQVKDATQEIVEGNETLKTIQETTDPLSYHLKNAKKEWM